MSLTKEYLDTTVNGISRIDRMTVESDYYTHLQEQKELDNEVMRMFPELQSYEYIEQLSKHHDLAEAYIKLITNDNVDTDDDYYLVYINILMKVPYSTLEDMFACHDTMFGQIQPDDRANGDLRSYDDNYHNECDEYDDLPF